MALRILSVDDELDMEDLILQKFRRKIRKGEIEFLFAHNGQEALDVLRENTDINIVLADINMPKMDGLEFLRRVNEKENPLLHVIMVSAYGDMKNLRTAMNLGAFDFITKPIDFSDMELTINKTTEVINRLIIQKEEMQRLSVIENEVKTAGAIQMSILPNINGKFKNYDNIEVSTFIKPALLVGGDLYNIYALDETHIGFLIADVSGKGIIAASFMLRCHTAFNIIAQQQMEPNAVLDRVNSFLCEGNEESMFVTTFYGVLNIETGLFTYSNGGHNPPMLYSDGKVTELPPTKNPALGIIPDIDYGLNNVQLAKGDVVLMFTDGVSEAQNTSYEEFGEERISQGLINNSNNSPTEINTIVYNAVKDFSGEAEQFDDITILTYSWQ